MGATTMMLRKPRLDLTKGLTLRSVHEIITHRMKRGDAIGVDDSQLATHSLRIGLAGSLAMDGKTDAEILKAAGSGLSRVQCRTSWRRGGELQGAAHKLVHAI